jgi:hypothetical protein
MWKGSCHLGVRLKDKYRPCNRILQRNVRDLTDKENERAHLLAVQCMENRAMKRRRTKHVATLEERLALQAQRLRQAADQEPMESTARELLLRRARQAETAAHINGWLTSPD